MLGFAVLVAGLIVASPPWTPGGDARAFAQNINTEREALGRDALQIDPALCRVAAEHAFDMANRGYFGHAEIGGISPFARFLGAHVRFDYGGEDIEFNRNVTSAERALWNSAAHRHTALLENFTRIGVAAVRTAQGEFFVEDFSG